MAAPFSSLLYAFSILCCALVAALPPPAARNNYNEATSLSLAGDELVTIPNITLPNASVNASNIAVNCFNNPAGRTLYKPVSLTACIAIFPTMLLQPNIMDNLQWSPYDPIWLPYETSVGDCKVELWTRFGNARDKFQEVLILQRAAMILDQCFRPRPQDQRLGGTVSIGDRAAFQVTLSHI